jgi:Na+-driven multidrug efflux pump
MVAGTAGTKAVAGFGTGARLEYLLIPIVFGVGAPLVAMIGTNIGAARKERTLRIALSGSLICFGLTETIGLAVTIWPRAWLELFGQDPEMLAAGAAYLHTVGPFYGFFGLGLSLYFASQGAGRLFWPLTAGLLRIVVAIGGGWLALSLSGSIFGLFIALGMGLVCYGTLMAYAVWRGAWFTAPRTLRRTPPAPTH